MKSWMLAGAAVVLVIVILAVSSMRRQDGAAPGSARNPAPTANKSNSVPSDEPVMRGKSAYFTHCIACHSPDTDEYIAGLALKNYFNNPPTKLSNGELFPRTDAAIRELIEKGTTNMPPLSKGMSVQEIDDILAYLHTL
ncbi:MAG: cytochrome c [Acidobacteria bacterium]|nr:cytochrome c [Acidobacteriota bacterium]